MVIFSIVASVALVIFITMMGMRKPKGIERHQCGPRANKQR